MRSFFKKDNNKGFTLVELIVVIAVIAIITVMAAPKLFEYVEKSKRGTDRNAVREVAHAVQVAYVDIKKDNPDDTKVVLSINDEGNSSYSRKLGSEPASVAADSDEIIGIGIVESVREILANNSYIYKSKLYRNSTITFMVEPSDGTVTISTTEGIAERQEQIKTERAEIEKLSKEVQELTEQFNEYTKNVEERTAKVEEYQKKVNEAQAKRDEVATFVQLDQKEQEAKTKREEADRINRDPNATRYQKRKAESAASRAELSLSIAKGTVSTYDTILEGAQAVFNTEKTALDTNKAILNTITTELNNKKAELDTKDNNLKTENEAYEKQKESADELQEHIDQFE